ncbi:MAG: hypothetical protein ACXVCY_13720 [Pseudobdellovibrionaceae bacterium]
MVKKLFALIFLMFNFRQSMASEFRDENDYTKDFKATILEVINNAEIKGWSAVGGFSFEKMKTDLTKIHHVVVLPTNISITMENKPFAFATWNKDSGTVFLNQKKWQTILNDRRFFEIKNGIFLHEFMGIAGINDEFYEFSLRLDYMTKHKAPAICSISLSSSKINQLILADGGGSSTGVSGGGDGFEFLVKKDMIDYFLNYWEFITRENPSMMKASILNSLFDIKIRLWQANMSDNNPTIIDDSFNNKNIKILAIGANKVQLAYESEDLYLKMVEYMKDQIKNRPLQKTECLY